MIQIAENFIEFKTGIIPVQDDKFSGNGTQIQNGIKGKTVAFRSFLKKNFVV